MWQKIKNVYHLFKAILANIYFGFPARDLNVIGVTGTDGKTTTVNLIYHILKVSGRQVSMVSTVGANIHGKASPLGFHVTNPTSFPLQRFLRDAAKKDGEGENYLVLEVTSHGLDQNRVWGIPFAVGVITNVTHEHLDYHKTYDEYLRTKMKLVQMAEVAIVNKDDESYTVVSKFKNQNAKSQLKNKKWVTFGLKTDSEVNPKVFPFKTSLPGEFNVYNCLAAVAVCKHLGLSDKEIREGLSSFTTPTGRMQKIENKKGLKIYIDYAHTANGIAQALRTVKAETKGKLIALIGAEGYRDERKRPVMGETATKLADVVVITAVDPRGLIDQINEQILAGVGRAGGKLGKNVFIENDREKAIDLAINKLAKRGDTIGIFGKGHERSMNMDGKKELPWSDFEAVEKALL